MGRSGHECLRKWAGLGTRLAETVLTKMCSKSPRSAAQSKSCDTERVESMRDSAERRAFQKSFAFLADGITDPGRLAIQLYSRELIGPDIRTEAQKPAIEERVKIEGLLSAVENQIVASPTTKFRDFLDVLQSEPSLQHLATRLESTHRELSACVPPSTSTPPSLHPVGTYASYLKSIYTQEKLPIYDKWPHVESKKYINLALVGKQQVTKRERDLFTRATIHGNIDDVKRSKRAIQIDQIAQLPDGSRPKCILVEGAPGVGKSTFAWKLCRKWGKGKLLQHYQLVVLLRLRDKSVRVASNISDLFRYHRHLIQQAAVEEIQDTGGQGVLLLFEGFDELPEELRTDDSVFLDIITRRELPEATVLITSRPWASEFLHMECKRHISQHIEILGFTKADIQLYLESTTANDASLLVDLKKYISCYPHINSLMYIPLNSAIVVEVYRNSRKDKTLVPKTMTELYSSLVRSLLLRYLYDHPVHGKKRRWRVRSFNDLPQDVYQQLCELGRIAYEGINNGQQVIFSDLPEDFETLGLMQCAPELYADEGAAVSYNFLHLTVQEYLAAFHLSQQPVEKQVKHFMKYCSGEDEQVNSHSNMMLRFLSGIRKFSGYTSEMMNVCVTKPTDDSASVVRKITFDTLHWLFEAQDSDVLAKLLGSSAIQLDKPDDVVTPFDCFVLGYSVSHSNCTWKIVLNGFNVGDEGVEMLLRGAVEEETHCTGGISEIKLCGDDITSEGVKHLSHFPKRLINKLERLYLHSNDFAAPNFVALTTCDLRCVGSLSITKGDALQIIDNSEGVMCFVRSLESGKEGYISSDWITPIKSVQWYFGKITRADAEKKLLQTGNPTGTFLIRDSETRPGDYALSIRDSDRVRHYCIISKVGTGRYYIAPRCTFNSLEELVRHYSGDADGLCCQLTVICPKFINCLGSLAAFPHLKRISFSFIGQGGAVPLIASLTAHNALEKLSLNSTGIGVEDCRALVQLLLSSTSLKKLNISCNHLSPEAVELIISGLCHNTTLEKLDMMGSYISLQNTISLASQLRTNHTLVELDLGFCHIDLDGACRLASALHTNDALQKLYVKGNSIGIKGATALAEMLKTNHTLVDLDLQQCNIDSDGACQLASALCTNDALEELNLWENQIGVKGATAIAEMLRINHTLVDLDLFQCNINSDGACLLASALCTNNKLEKLNIFDNPIGDKGAAAFAEMLLENKSLKKLDLGDDSIGEEGVRKLINSLTYNKTVKELAFPSSLANPFISSGVDSRVRFIGF